MTPFEEKTGCKASVKTFGTSDEAYQLFATGQYDVVSASGDATLRVVANGDAAPLNTDLLTNYADLAPFLKEKAWNSVEGTVYGEPHGWGANLLMYNENVVTPAPDSWGVVFDGELALQGQDHRLRLTDLHRRCRSVSLEDAAGPRDHRSVRARPEAVRCGHRAAQAAEGQHRRVLVRLPEGTGGLHEGQLGTRHHLAGHHERCASRHDVAAGEGDHPEGGFDGLVRQLDGVQQDQASELLVRVAELDHEPRRAGPGRRVLRRSTGQPQGV